MRCRVWARLWTMLMCVGGTRLDDGTVLQKAKFWELLYAQNTTERCPTTGSDYLSAFEWSRHNMLGHPAAQCRNPLDFKRNLPQEDSLLPPVLFIMLVGDSDHDVLRTTRILRETACSNSCNTRPTITLPLTLRMICPG